MAERDDVLEKVSLKTLNFVIKLFCIMLSWDVMNKLSKGELVDEKNNLNNDSYEYLTSSQYSAIYYATVTSPNLRNNDSLKQCQELLKNCSIEVSNFSNCAISKARPAYICQACMVNFLRVSHVQYLITEASFEVHQDIPCSDYLMKNERNYVVQKAFQFVADLWKSSNCYNCFTQSTDENETLTFSVSNETLEFFQQVNNTVSCLEKYEEEINNISQFVKTDNSTCKLCEKDYQNLNDLFSKIVIRTSGQACLDVVDKMDDIRYRWSDELQCIIIKKDYFTVVLFSATFCLFPLVFYVAVRVQASTQYKKLAKQNRLKIFAGKRHKEVES